MYRFQHQRLRLLTGCGGFNVGWGFRLTRTKGLAIKLRSLVASIPAVITHGRAWWSARGGCRGAKVHRMRMLILILSCIVIAAVALAARPPVVPVRVSTAEHAGSPSGGYLASLTAAQWRDPSSTALADTDGNSSSFGSLSATKPVDVVIAVDESGSILPYEMTEERQAARLIALGEFAPDSRVEVLGFGGADTMETQSNPQPPVDQVCPLTQVSTAASRQGLSDCIGKLHVRTEAEGWNTDFISVIDQAVSDLAGSGDSGRPRLLF